MDQCLDIGQLMLMNDLFIMEKFGNAVGSLKGITQLSNFNPYQLNYFNTMAWQRGVNVYGTGHTAVAYNRRDLQKKN